jgi:hypothetical protein
MHGNVRRSHLKVWVTHLLLDLPYNLHTHLVFRYVWRPDTHAGILVLFVLSTIVNVACSCTLLCRLSWVWNFRARYYVDYRESGISVHCIMLTIVNLSCSCKLLCRLSRFWNLRTLYYVDYREVGMLVVHFIIQQLYLSNCWRYVANEYSGWQDQGRMGIQRIGKTRPLLTLTQT